MVRKTEASHADASEAPLSLDRLYFGKDDAESDFARGGLLKQGFMRTRAYEEAIAGRKTLIIGRKGSGKSAICLMLRDTLSPTGRCAVITPDEISADEVRRFQLPGIPAEQSKQLIWRYVFLVQIAKFIVVESRKQRNRSDGSKSELASIQKFLQDNGESDDLNILERFWKIVERLKGSISVEAFAVKIKVDSSLEPPSSGTRAHDKLDLVEASLRRAANFLRLVADESPFHLLIDQIEKVWSNDRESDAMVVGLLLSAKAIQAAFEFVICTVFLRTDIYEQLQFQDRDKLRGDEFHIDWDENSLVELILARAEASLGQTISPEHFWKSLFPHEIDSQPSKKFLVARTLMRPRDIIQLSNACRDMARNNRHNTIESSDIQRAMILYSGWKLNDLQNEWSVNYPFLPEAFLLLSNSSYMISKLSIETSLSQIQTDLTARYPSLAHMLTTHTFLSILYSIGIVGIVRDGSALYAFNSRNGDEDVKISDNSFIIHPCFRGALQSTSAIKLKPYEADFEPLRRIEIINQIRVGANTRAGKTSLRGSRGSRAIQYVLSSIDRLPNAVSGSRLPEELREEISRNLDNIVRELESVDDYDELAAREILARISRHLSQMIERLNEGRWLNKEKNLDYVLRETIEGLERSIYKGDLGEFLS